MGKIDKTPDLDVLAAKKELETRIHQILIKLPGLVRHRLQSHSLWRIAECMKVTKNTYDFGRLSVYYHKPFAPRPKKYDCVRALATFVIVKWWDYSLGRNKSPFPVAFLDQLENIVEKGLKAFECEGTFAKGFKLVEKGRPNPIVGETANVTIIDEELDVQDDEVIEGGDE